MEFVKKIELEAAAFHPPIVMGQELEDLAWNAEDRGPVGMWAPFYNGTPGVSNNAGLGLTIDPIKWDVWGRSGLPQPLVGIPYIFLKAKMYSTLLPEGDFQPHVEINVDLARFHDMGNQLLANQLLRWLDIAEVAEVPVYVSPRLSWLAHRFFAGGFDAVVNPAAVNDHVLGSCAKNMLMLKALQGYMAGPVVPSLKTRSLFALKSAQTFSGIDQLLAMLPPGLRALGTDYVTWPGHSEDMICQAMAAFPQPWNPRRPADYQKSMTQVWGANLPIPLVHTPDNFETRLTGAIKRCALHLSRVADQGGNVVDEALHLATNHKEMFGFHLCCRGHSHRRDYLSWMAYAGLDYQSTTDWVSEDL